MTHYHPSIEILTDYAAGSLPLAHSLCVSTHLEHCPECQQQIRKLEMLGSHLFDQAQTENRPLSNLKDSFFKNLAQQPAQESVKSTQQDKDKDTQWDDYAIPRSLRQFISKSYDELSWMRLSPSFKIATLYNEEGGAQVALTRVKAGAHMPTHTHTGDEITLVLEGAFSDDSGVYRQGDFICRDASHKHKPMVTEDAECICLTVLDAPIEFTGWFTRLLNPIIRRYHPHSHT
ncbi:anti-sigma factor [Marinomonas sp. M1K-6]|uniref:Anti-sigma factor n=1 Tax=Marinomonas profundi TaxID=2726122 RepID=A0A847RCU7_9GAMM|nr:ChrR family anti-sigma-E factor [Marinomonas profundi]NLQ18854.1 anti-sigma factor [Marinomonas profundi]UDV01782.1 ChrR family anti-sigma-E factor [Marinomonas profundi]